VTAGSDAELAPPLAATAAPRPAPSGAPLDPKTANVLYHDAAALDYDRKWSISFDERSVSYVRERAVRMLPRNRYERVLEVGCGTGFLLLNLWQAGFVREAHACDISPGMLEVCGENARRLGCDVELRAADAERLPFPDAGFDLVVGHAFLHHLPQPGSALREMFRVLRPGGAVFIAGEPTRLGDRIAGVAKRVAWRGFEAAARLRPELARPRADDQPTEDQRILRDLEFAVDLHTFEPRQVEGWARAAGFQAVRTETEELVSGLFGWSVRTVEALVRPGLLGERWARFAYRNWLRLYRFDQAVLYRIVPKRAFYNLLLYGERLGG
jgi:ubiquinone/menaquinone biosynthesis C-methylase UbiE